MQKKRIKIEEETDMSTIPRAIAFCLMVVFAGGFYQNALCQKHQPGKEVDSSKNKVNIGAKVDTVQSDTTARYIKITTNEGQTYKGKFVREDSSQIVLKNVAGVFYIYKKQIKDREPYSVEDPSSQWFKNPNVNRMFVMPTGRMMESGSGYYQNMYVLVSSLSIALSDFLSGSVGMSMVPGVGLDNNLLFGSLKLGTEIEKQLHGAAGITFLSVADESATFGFGMLTYGTNNRQLSVGYGTGLGEEGISGQNNMVIVGGEIRVSEHIALASENWLGKEQIISYGVRFIGESVSADLAFFRVLEEEVNLTGLGIPYVDFVYHF